MSITNTDASGAENTLQTSEPPKSDEQQYYVVVEPDGAFDHTSIRLDESEAIREYVQNANFLVCMANKDLAGAVCTLSDGQIREGWEILQREGSRVCRVTIIIVG